MHVNTEPLADEQIDQLCDRVMAPYDFIPTTEVPKGYHRMERARKLLKYWRDQGLERTRKRECTHGWRNPPSTYGEP